MKRCFRWKVVWVLIALLATGATGCGYRMSGGGSLPEGIQTIAIAMLENKTAETGLETVMTDALITELNRRRKDTIVAVDRAQAVLGGTIESAGSDTVAFRDTQTALERRIYVVASLVLTRKDGQVLWRGNKLRVEQAYAVSRDDATVSDTGRSEALVLLSAKLAEAVMRRLTDNF